MAIVNPIGLDFRVSPGGGSHPVQEPSGIVTLGNGNFAVIFDSLVAGVSGVYARIFGPTGTPIGGDILLAQNARWAGATALSGGGFAITWRDGPSTELRAQRFDDSAAAAGSPILVEDLGAGSYQWRIGSLADGGFVVGWMDEAERELRIKIYDADGQATSDDILVTALRAGYGIGSIVQLSDGNFIVQWAERADPPSTSHGVFTQRFDTAGNRIGSEVMVADTGEISDHRVAAALPGGGFVATWFEQHHEEGTSNDVYAQIIDGDDNKVGQPFLVTTTTAGYQIYPSVVTLSDGNFVIAWQDAGASSGQDDDLLFAQIFDASGARIGTEFQFNAGIEPLITALPGSGFAVTWYRYTGTSGSDRVAEAQIFDFAGNGTEGDAGANIVMGTAGVDELKGNGGNDTLYGASGNDRIMGDGGDDESWAGEGKDRLDAGSGIDKLHGERGADRLYFYATLTAEDIADGCVGSDTLYLRGAYANLVFAATTVTGIETIHLAENYSYRLTTHDATVANGTTLTIEAGGLHADETLYFDGSAETGAGSRFVIVSGEGSDTLGGGAGGDVMNAGIGRDTLFGYSGNDTLTGGANSDRIVTGNGNDVVAYANAVESSSRNFDTIVGFNANLDRFDLPGTVTGIGPTIATGRLLESDLNTDLAAAANATTLLPGHAVLFTPDRGDHAGKTFLIVDANGIAGYQAREDFVFLLENPTNLAGLTPADFI